MSTILERINKKMWFIPLLLDLIIFSNGIYWIMHILIS